MKKHLLFLASTLLCLGAFSQNTDRIQVAGGKVIGMTSSAGSHGGGIVFQFNTTTSRDSICHDIIANQGRTIYGAPRGNTLVRTHNGMLYGMTRFGGAFGIGGLYSYNPYTNKDSLMLSFNWINGDEPQGGLMLASSGLLYGMTIFGGDNGDGVLFSYNPTTNADSILVNMSDSTGINPYYGKLVQAKNGKIYGMTNGGGSHNKGAVFCYNPANNADNIVANLDSVNGQYPYGGLILANDSMLYGMATYGGAHDSGVIFRFNPYTNKDSVLFNFGQKSGGIPFGSLMQASNGYLYGLTGFGGTSNLGTMFCFNIHNYRDSVLVNFNITNGQWPDGDNRLIQASNGILYGLTHAGGLAAEPYGTLFSYNPTNGHDSVLATFSNGQSGGSPGIFPYDALTADTTGILYGVTQWGGTYNYGGVLFSYNIATKTTSTLVNLGGSSSNNGYLTQATNGMVYGMTSYGGTNSLGTIFEINPTTSATSVLHSFQYTEGGAPYDKLLQANDGNLYGTTSQGSGDNIHNYGTLFQFNPTTNAVNVVLNFSVDPGGGSEPRGGVIQSSIDHLLYGMTMRSTTHGGYGVLYSYNLSAPNQDSVRIYFADTNGASPFGPPTQLKNTNILYGLTALGGKYNSGVLFSYNTVTGQDSTLVNFKDTLGQYPFGGLLQSSLNGSLYGMTSQGGLHDKGVILRFYPGTKKDTVVFNFNGADGAVPVSSFIQDASGNLYACTRYGGTHNNGVLFSFNTITNAETVLLNFNADSGANPTNIIFLTPTPASINEVQQPKDLILVYPNPFTNVATVVFSEQGTHYVELDDMNGQKLRWIESTGTQCQIARNNLATGVYIVKVYDGDKNFIASSKIVVSGQ